MIIYLLLFLLILRERLQAMKDLYHKISLEIEQSSVENEDPFYDDFPWFSLIGRFVPYFEFSVSRRRSFGQTSFFNL